MATQVLKEFLVAIGFKVDSVSFNKQSETISNYEKSIVEAEKRVDQARLKSAKNLEQRNKIEAELHLKALKRGLEEAKATEENQRRQAVAIAGAAATVAVAVAAAMAAIGNAIRNTIGEFDRLSYVSARTGASVGNIKAIGYAFSQTGSSAEAAVQALENFGRARRANPGVDGLLRSYGVGTSGDSSEVLSNALDAITKRHPQYTAQQVAGLLGISPDEVDHWIRYRKEIEEFNRQYKDLQRTFGVNGGEMARSSTAISRAIGEMSAIFEVLKQKLVSLFLPAIEAVATALADLLKSLTSEENIKAIGDYFEKPIAAIKEMVRWVKALYDQFVMLFEYVRNSPIGKIIGAINPGFFREKFLDSIIPGSAQAGESFGGGGSGGGGAGGGSDNRSWWQRHAPKVLGGKDAPGGAMQDAAPGTPGKYRPVRALTDRDLSDATINTIAGEARLKTPGGADAVINNMFNRLGSKGWGPSRDLQDVARAPGQYAGYRRATPAEAEYIRGRIRAIASGGVPDNTNGANSFRASWYRGPWWRKHGQFGKDVGGNTFAYDPSIPNGPYAPYKEPKADAPAPTRPVAPRMNMTPGGFNVDNYLKSNPMGSSSTSNDNSRSVSQNNPVTVNVQGGGDPQATGQAVARAVGQANDMSLRNVQTAIR